jgi:pantetheine-phosphate adenylyltransferase
VARAARLVDKRVLVIGVPHGKAGFLDAETRVSLLETVVKPIAEHTGVKIAVVTFDGLAVDAARIHQAGLIIRGFAMPRTDYEVQMG